MDVIKRLWDRLTGRDKLLARIDDLESQVYAMEDQIVGLQDMMEEHGAPL
jgi:hypothetical protein